MELPFVAGLDNFLNITIISSILRSSGGFFVDSKLYKDKLFRAVLSAYVSELREKNYPIEIFIEPTR